MSRLHIPFALLATLVPVFAGCSSDPAPTEDVRPTVDEPTSFGASDVTKKETGVVVWGGDMREGVVRVVGYDARGAKVVTFEQRTTAIDDHHHAIETSLKTADVDALMRLDGTTGDVNPAGEFDLEVKTTVNTFEDSPRATAILGMLRSDLEGGQASASLLHERAVAPLAAGQQLVDQSCTQLLTTCGRNLVRVGSTLVSCVQLGRSLVQTGRCTLVGGSGGGVVGWAIAGAVCTLANGYGLYTNGRDCYNGLQDLYNNGNQLARETMEACGGVRSSCFGGGGPAVSSVAPSL